jgi:SAM-dependent methyltransferase
MPDEVNLYDSHYGQIGTDPQMEVRQDTYGEDLGQASWITAREAARWFDLLNVGPGHHALEVACGSGGVTCALATHTGAHCAGVDINLHGIEAARKRAESSGISSQVSFQVADASQRLPFPDGSVDAVFCNDSINHLPDRLAVLRDWHRLLRPGRRALYTDPIVVTGQLSNEEIRVRSSIGFFLFTPVGENERLLEQAGFAVLQVEDVTDAVASVSTRWRDARAKRRERLIPLEGEDAFEALQRFLNSVHTLSSERRLSRFMYLAEKRPRSGEESR